MRLRYSFTFRVIAIATLLAVVLCGCGRQEETVPAESSAPVVLKAESALKPTVVQTMADTLIEEESETPKAYDTISVGVYPYIPDVPLFEQLLTEYWAEIEPDVKLEFVSWDCYGKQDPSGLDILMYDALFTDSIVENGYVQSIKYSDIQNENGKQIIPFAMDGAVHNDTLYGIPFLVCSFFLIHYADDTELAAVNNFPELYEVVSKRQTEDSTTGLLADYQLYTPYYLPDAMMDFSGEYSLYEENPDIYALDDEVVHLFKQMKSMLAPKPDLGDEVVWSAYATAFNRGTGCAYYGYSEDMCDMDDIIDKITIRSISFSEGENIPIFFADIASIASRVTDPQKLEDCKKILNIIASKDFQLDLCLGGGEAPYILPARQSVYAKLEDTYPMYENLHKLVVNDTNKVYRIGPDIYNYFSDAAVDLPF